MIGVRVAMHSLSPNNIVFPTLLTTLFSTALGVLLTWVFLRPKKHRQRVHAPIILNKHQKIKEAGMR
jgi:spore maturation protein SpmA